VERGATLLLLIERDITERQRVEQRMRQFEEQSRKARPRIMRSDRKRLERDVCVDSEFSAALV